MKPACFATVAAALVSFANSGAGSINSSALGESGVDRLIAKSERFERCCEAGKGTYDAEAAVNEGSRRGRGWRWR